jgi:hypothetical protein
VSSCVAEDAVGFGLHIIDKRPLLIVDDRDGTIVASSVASPFSDKSIGSRDDIFKILQGTRRTGKIRLVMVVAFSVHEH